MVELVDISNDGIRQSYDLQGGMREHMTLQPTGSMMPQNSPLIAPPSNPEKNTLSEVEMNLSTPIEEVLDTPMGLMHPQVGIQQPEMIDARTVQSQATNPVQLAKKSASPNPFNLNDDQMLSLIAGAAAVVAFSKPVQAKVSEFIPTAFGMDGQLSTTGLALTALIAAIAFYILKNFALKR